MPAEGSAQVQAALELRVHAESLAVRDLRQQVQRVTVQLGVVVDQVPHGSGVGHGYGVVAHQPSA